MCDQSFVERYWGSDDSGAEGNSDEQTDNLKAIILKAKKRKSIHDNVKQVSEVSDNLNITNSNESKIYSTNEVEKLFPVIKETDVAESKEQKSKLRNMKAKKRKLKHDNTEQISNDITSNSTEKEISITDEKGVEKHNGEQTDKSEKNVKSKKRKLNNVDAEQVSNDMKNSIGTSKERGELFPVIKDVLNKKNEIVPRSLPDWLANPTKIEIDVHGEETNISELDFLNENTKTNLLKHNIKYLFPVQIQVIPWLLQTSSKRLFFRPSDICVSATTGSGKTLAYVIPILQSLQLRTVRQIRALIVLPVADLAVQVFKVFESFCKGTDIRVVLVIGHSSFSQEQVAIVENRSRGALCLTDIIVSTPGRLLDHIDRTPGFSLEHLQYLVIDEADRMMEEIQQGWLKKVENAVYKSKTSSCPCFSTQAAYQKTSMSILTPCSFGHALEPMQKLFYSATLSQDPERLHELQLYRPKLFSSISKPNSIRNPTQVDCISSYTTPQNLVEHYILCNESIKPLAVCQLIHEKSFKRVLCFTHSLEHSHRLHLVLNEMLADKNVRELSSNLTGVQRKIILQQFNSGKVKVLVCSDMMARGMDLEDVDCVICYDVPRFIKAYIHRVGRTARAGKHGIAITLLDKDGLPVFKKMLTQGGKSLPSKLDLNDEGLKSLEQDFTTALATVSTIIDAEKRELSHMKKGVYKHKRLKQNMQ